MMIVNSVIVSIDYSPILITSSNINCSNSAVLIHASRENAFEGTFALEKMFPGSDHGSYGSGTMHGKHCTAQTAMVVLVYIQVAV